MKKKKDSIIPIILGVVVIALIIGGVLIFSFFTKKEQAEANSRKAVEAEDDGEAIDYEKKGIIKLGDYKGFKETTDPKESDDWETLIWDDFLETCEIEEYPEKLEEEAILDTQMQYQGFAEASGVSYEDIMSEYSMDDDTVRDVARDTVKGRLVAKTIAVREGFKISDSDLDKYLKKMMECSENDKSTSEELMKDYLEGYSVRPKDDIYIEMVKELLLKNNPGK